MLVDTTVWTEFFRGKETKQVVILGKAILQRDTIFYCGLVLTEICRVSQM